MSDVSAVLLQNTFKITLLTSPFSDADACDFVETPPPLAAYQVSNSGLLLNCCFRFYSATCPDWFCWISYAEIPVEVIETKSGLLTFATWRYFVLQIWWRYS